MRLKIAKLAASPVLPLVTKPKFKNELLDQTWPQDVNYLRDTYNDVVMIWDELKTPETDKLLFQRTEPKLRELIVSLMDVVPKVPWMPIVRRHMNNAHHDFEIAVMYSRAGDYGSASIYLSYALVKIHDVLESLTRAASVPAHQRKSSLDGKTAYGYDISGEVFEGSGEMANRENQTNINDTAQPQDHHETPPNPANLMHDTEADKEFPELAKSKSEKIQWPPRNR